MSGQLLWAITGGIFAAVCAWAAMYAADRRQAEAERVIGVRAGPKAPSRTVRLGRRLGRRRSLTVVLFVAVVLVAIALGWQWLALSVAIPWISGAILRAGTRSEQVRLRRELDREVGPALDVFVLSLEAGLPFDGALAAYTTTVHSRLATELGVALRELEVGYRRREVLQRLVARTGSPTLGALERAVRLAEDLGSPLASGLRSLAAELRAVRRQRLQEAALRAPVTMLLPTAGLILVPIFAIVLGPIVIRVASGSFF